MSSLTFANPSPQVHPVSGAPGGRPSVLGICANPPNPPNSPVLTGSAPGMEAASHVPSVQPWAGLVLWASCGCSSSIVPPSQVVLCVPSHVAVLPTLAGAGLLVTVQHAALFCPCSAISLSQGHSGGFQLLCYMQPCVSPSPLLIVSWVIQKWGDQLWCSWSQSEIRRETWALCVLSGHVGKCMDLLVK